MLYGNFNKSCLIVNYTSFLNYAFFKAQFTSLLMLPNCKIVKHFSNNFLEIAFNCCLQVAD